jgi:hypothetical protein
MLRMCGYPALGLSINPFKALALARDTALLPRGATSIPFEFVDTHDRITEKSWVLWYVQVLYRTVFQHTITTPKLGSRLTFFFNGSILFCRRWRRRGAGEYVASARGNSQPCSLVVDILRFIIDFVCLDFTGSRRA